jgi:phage major head subunit gpT-like protein
MAKGVQRLLADAVYDVFNANIEMGDGKPLFCPEHKNIVNLNGDAVPTMESLTKALYALKTMTDAFNRPLAIRPSFLLFPLSLEAHSEQFFSNQFQVIPAPMGVKNIYYNFASRIYENRLDTQNPLVWYILGPNNTNVKVVYLNGNKSPYVETVDNFNIDGITTKVRFDFGVTAPTWRSMIKVVNTPLS